MHIILMSQITIDGKITIGKNKNSRLLIEQLPKDFLKDIHSYRAKYDAILVGANTIRIDNPSLTNRYCAGSDPKRIIISENLNFTFNEKIFTDNNETIIITKCKQKKSNQFSIIKEKGKKCIFIEDNKFKMNHIINILEEQENIKTLIVEGGGQINWEFCKENLIDELFLYLVPIIIGGHNTVTLVEGIDNETLLNQYNLLDVKKKENCIRLHYRKENDEN